MIHKPTLASPVPSPQFEGVFPVVPTPLSLEEDIDYGAFSSCLNHYLGSEVKGLTLLGSGGELPYFSDAEQLAIAQHAHRQVAGQKTLLTGVNVYGEYQAKDKIKQLSPFTDAVMLLLCDYYRCSFAAVKATVKAIAASADVPVFYYHYPQVSGLWFSAAELSELLALDNVVGIKDSALQLKNSRFLLKHNPDKAYFTGMSLLLPDLIPLGASGAICPLAAIAPQLAAKHYQALKQQDLKQSAPLHKQLQHLLPVLTNPQSSGLLQFRLLQLVSRSAIPLLKSATSLHANTKAALALQGVAITPIVRAPLPAYQPHCEADIERCLQLANIA